MAIYALSADRPALPPEGRFWIAPDAHVIGRVTLGDEVGVWFGAVLRGDNEPIVVGDRSNIQEGAVVHVDAGFPVTIGSGCTIGHRAIVHGCTIGDNCLIGMGATILNGAVLGRNCLVGANALVTEGKTFEDNSLIVGSPARAIRLLDAQAVARLEASAACYVRNWRHFACTLTRLHPES
ncbi:gamma carbonic anhydrase family protein [Xaviernesmea oryzae]|uniref:Gamma carbonic anhydrase family protein n=1 Tax=Xaviernesmea oryzae TaxID=464029 RepID=A0A1Q9B0F6_9HYPH|nr:gamma carbonic anhydrase family protein [Xaviernesmea oryzae]OLP61469.1 gamma carbonic anhydrase family protein [Xaviernesmea oryzae]SEL68343.1 Carbonic anhydrase or acetyltransferase, isoleucine patch superfamily [Xaviernesmea oryzae]